jgi:hypothetical protein
MGIYRYFLLLVFLPLFSGCSKTNQKFDELKTKSDLYQSSIMGNRYQLIEFYSDKPIDYLGDDTLIRRETALWQYVKPYLVDDENAMDMNGEIIINQKLIMNPSIDSSYIFRTYKFSNDDKEVYFDFVDYYYNPMKYKVRSIDNSSILIYIDWPNGAKLYSRYKRVL